MADKKVDATTGEVQEEKKYQYFDRQKVEFPNGPDTDSCVKVYRFHCKPVYNYQSVEFDFDVRSDNLTEDMMSLENNLAVFVFIETFTFICYNDQKRGVTVAFCFWILLLSVRLLSLRPPKYNLGNTTEIP